MKKAFRFFALAALALAGAAQALAAASAPLVYGFMAESDEWRDDQDNAYCHYGFYTFRADGSESFQEASPISPDYDWATQAGVYADGKFYCYSTSGNWMKYTLHFRALDASTWVPQASNGFTYTSADKEGEESQKAYLVPTDLAYDPIGDVIYAAARRYESQLEPYLCTVDRATGLLTRIASIPSMAALTCDPSGQLYGIGMDGYLYKVGHDGACSKIGHTGFWPAESLLQSATFDFRNGDIYWSLAGFASERDRMWNENGLWRLMRVNPADASAETTYVYPRDQRFTSLAIMTPHPSAPDDVDDLSFAPEAFGSNTGVLSMTVPAKTYGQAPLSAPVTVRIYIDNALAHTVSAQPGQSISYKAAGLATGKHTAYIELDGNGYTGNKVYASAYLGIDAPAKIEKVTLSHPDGDNCTAIVAWDAPTTGENGGDYDASKIRYKVVRYPGEVVVKRSLKETSFTEAVDYNYTSTYYVVTPYNNDEPSAVGHSTRSNSLMLGHDLALPYSETFDKESSLNAFTLIDVDGDGNGEWRSPCWKYDPEYLCAFYYGVSGYNANDWLVTPPLAFDRNRLYRLTYKYYGYYGYGNHFQVAVGPQAEDAALGRVIQDIQKVTTFYDKPGIEESVVFSVREGDRYVGFHHLSQNMEHLSIDDIRIVDAGDARIPDLPTAVSGVRLGVESLSLTFTMPTAQANSDPLEGKLSARIYRNLSQAPVAEIKDLAAGQTVTWTDEAAVKGVNNFYICAVNSYGDGLMAEVSVNLADPVPLAPELVYAQYVNDRQVLITWAPVDSEVGANGNPIDSDQIRYLVFKPIPLDFGYEYRLIGRDVVGCRFVDDNPFDGLAEGQQVIQYYVEAVNGAGAGEATLSNGVVVGPAYSLPFAETWKNQSQDTAPWIKHINNGATWYVRHKGYEPLCDAQDGYGLLVLEANTDYPQGMGGILSPYMDLTSMADPEVSFYYYRSPQYVTDMYLRIALLIDGDSQYHYIGDSYNPYTTGAAGWEKVTIPLSQYADQKRVSVMLLGFTHEGNNIYFDNFRVEGSQRAGQVRPEYITGPASLRQGAKHTFVGTVANHTASDAANVAVRFFAGSEQFGSATIPSIPAGQAAEVEFDFVPEAKHVGTTVITIATTQTELAVKEVNVAEINLAYVTDLKATQQDNNVALAWGAPTCAEKAQAAIDGFELYDDFAIDGIGAWTVYDGDGNMPFRFNDGNGAVIAWPNNDKPQSFMVFNPGKLAVAPGAQPFDGDKYMACFGAAGGNDDWFISPELTGDKQVISFYARSFAADSEPFYVLASRTDANPDSFIRLNGNTPEKTTADWDLYYFELPEGTKHFAINYVGQQKTGMVIDAIYYYGYHNPVAPDGYNVYRDGAKINAALVTDRKYTDAGAADQTHTYTVRAVYNGAESLDSNVAYLGMTGIAPADAPAAVTVTASDGAIIVSGAAGANVAIYRPDGTMAASLTATDRSEIPVSAGIYLVSIDGAPYKVAVK